MRSYPRPQNMAEEIVESIVQRRRLAINNPELYGRSASKLYLPCVLTVRFLCLVDL